MNKKVIAGLCTILLTLLVVVSVAHAITWRITEHSGYKTFSPWGALGELRVNAIAVSSGGETPSKVTWNIGIFGPGAPSLWWWVTNGDPPQYIYGGSAYAYNIGHTYYVTVTSYGWSYGHYQGFKYYSVYLYYDGTCVYSRIWQLLEEIGYWP